MSAGKRPGGRPTSRWSRGRAPSRPDAPARTRVSKHLYSADTPGWRGRTTRGVLAMLARWERSDRSAVLAELEAAGASRSEARQFVRKLLDEGKAHQIRATLSLDVFKGEVPAVLLDLVLRQATIEVQGETDAPVTTDIHRLIRLPGSLHGGTGLRVTPLSLEELDGVRPPAGRDPPRSVGGDGSRSSSRRTSTTRSPGLERTGPPGTA